MDNNKFNIILKNFIVFFSYFIWQIVPTLILSLFSISVSNLDNIHKNIYLILSNLTYLLILIIVYHKELKIDFNKFKNDYKYIIRKYLPIYILGVILMGLSNIFISNITHYNISINEQNVRMYIKLFPIYMFFSSTIYAPIVEEITFRKTFKNILNNKYLFIVISGLLFGIVHISNLNDINDYLMIIPYVIMGIDFSYIYYKTNTIFSTIIFHSFHNLILIIIQFIGG